MPMFFGWFLDRLSSWLMSCLLGCILGWLVGWFTMAVVLSPCTSPSATFYAATTVSPGAWPLSSTTVPNESCCGRSAAGISLSNGWCRSTLRRCMRAAAAQTEA